MKKIRIFLASSNELIEEREKFEREIYRKCKAWFDKGVFLHVDIWEDLSARISHTRSQYEYNKKIKEAVLFVLLAYSKVGMYTAEEFETAFGAFQTTQKPFILTYFKDITSGTDPSLQDFKNKLKALGHFYSSYTNFDNLWIQFNKELDRLLLADFEEFKFVGEDNKTQRTVIMGDKGIYIEKADRDVNIDIK
ncbi:MAG: hypothetical protein K8R68_06730 [Bacteroidales bacterium]|nr:hypothetical protein [Bacteroidales bacterium]